MNCRINDAPREIYPDAIITVFVFSFFVVYIFWWWYNKAFIKRLMRSENLSESDDSARSKISIVHAYYSPEIMSHQDQLFGIRGYHADALARFLAAVYLPFYPYSICTRSFARVIAHIRGMLLRKTYHWLVCSEKPTPSCLYEKRTVWRHMGFTPSVFQNTWYLYLYVGQYAIIRNTNTLLL